MLKSDALKRVSLLFAVVIGSQGCGSDATSSEPAHQSDIAGETGQASGDGLTSNIDVGDKSIELTTEQSSANIPLGLPALPEYEVAYEMNSGVDGKLKYSGSFNTQMDMPSAMKFYADAIAEKGGEITRDDRKDGRSFQSIQGDLPDNKEFYVHVTDLKEKRGYTQVDLKLRDK